MERIGVFKSEVEGFRAKENGFFKFGMELFDTAASYRTFTENLE